MILEDLLRRVRDGGASADEVVACRALVATDPRVPDELREGLLEDDPAGDAAGLLAILGADDLDLSAAVLAESGGVELALELAALERVRIPIAEAIAAEAGDIEIAAQFGSPAVPLGVAIAAEAGGVDLWPAVSAAIGAAALPVADAIRTAAGPVDLWADVEAVIRPKPIAANNNRWWLSGLVAAAAAALLFVGWPAGNPIGDDTPLVLAGSAETRIESVVASDKVTVMQLEGDEGAVILWIEDNEPGEVL
jgi:hypothetical protein